MRRIGQRLRAVEPKQVILLLAVAALESALGALVNSVGRLPPVESTAP